MNTEEKELLERIMANQYVLFSKLEKIENKLKGKTVISGYRSAIVGLDREAKKVLGMGEE